MAVQAGGQARVADPEGLHHCVWDTGPVAKRCSQSVGERPCTLSVHYSVVDMHQKKYNTSCALASWLPAAAAAAAQASMRQHTTLHIAPSPTERQGDRAASCACRTGICIWMVKLQPTTAPRPLVQPARDAKIPLTHSCKRGPHACCCLTSLKAFGHERGESGGIIKTALLRDSSAGEVVVFPVCFRNAVAMVVYPPGKLPG